MPLSGFAAINIHDKASGKLVRRLIAEVPREQGKINEGWDLKDSAGQPVGPGSYTWHGIVRPPFKLTYEMSVYNAGIPAWFAPPPAKGGGSWIADHTMASDVAAQKEMIWISAPCAESGNSMIATDLDGVKQWGTGMGHFGFDGPRKIAADERCAYAATANMLFRVDPTRAFAARNIFMFPNEAGVPWQMHTDISEGAGGLAVRDGKLYYAVCTPSSWLRPSFVSDSIDTARCKPMGYLYKGKGRRTGRDDKRYDFYEYDELMLLYATFLCEKTPAETPGLPNNPLNSHASAFFGDAPKNGPWRGSVVLAFKQPIPVGSILIPDGGIQVLAMKPDHKMPDSKGEVADGPTSEPGKLAKDSVDEAADLIAEVKEQEGASSEWVLLKHTGVPGKPAIVNAPEGGLMTTALRFKTNRLRYGLVMTHRFEDVAPLAKRLFKEGAETPGGGWRVARTDVAVNECRPAMAALAWEKKQQLRGITLEKPPAGNDHVHVKIAIDAWVAPASVPVLEEDASWKQIALRDINYAPMLERIDFGGNVETAGLRIRFLSVVKEFGKFDAGFNSITALHPIGGEAKDLPPDLTQRVSVFKLPPPDDDKAPATFERHIPLLKPGQLAFDAAGTLHCISDGQIVTVPLKDGEQSRVVVAREKLEQPLALSFAPDGSLFVTDNGPKIVKVFKPVGQAVSLPAQAGQPAPQAGATLLHSFGTPGGLKPGKWDATKLNCPSGLAVDAKGRAWVADWCWAPKRVIRYAPDGKVEKEFLGPTQYGGGGTMDCRDRKVIYYAGMKFVLDWDARTWKLDSLLGQVVDRTIYWKDRRYLTAPVPGDGKLAIIAEEKGDVAKLMVVAGRMSEWSAVRASAGSVAKPMVVAGRMSEWAAVREIPELREKFGALDLGMQFFVWSDLNGDGRPQADEVQVTPWIEEGWWTVGEDLTLVSRMRRLRPAKILPDGVPVYDVKTVEPYNSSILQGHNDNPWGDDQGRIFMTGAKLIGADGKTMLWDYPNKFNHHDGFYASGFGYNRPPGVLNQEHSPIGHIKVGKEEYFITNTDSSDWFCYSSDGILVGCIMGGPAGYGKKAWSMPEWEPGKTDLSDLRPGQEHYQGCVVNTDGHVYAIAGHNHISVVRVDGLEQVQRVKGELTVSPEDIEKTRQWALREAAREQAAQAPKIAKMLRSSGGPEIDGNLTDWPEDLFVNISETTKQGLREHRNILDGAGALAFDSKNLYVAMRVRDESPLCNNAEDVLTLFKGGDAGELTLRFGGGPDVPAGAEAGATAGDIRLLFAKVKGKPVVVLYKPVDPTAPADKHREFSSPVGRLRMDRVEVLASAKIAFDVKKLKVVSAQGQQKKDAKPELDGTYWHMEAAIPWQALGVTPPEIGAKLGGDFGFLESDENGTQTIGRKYWSGKTQTVICDLPSEARLNPSLWGRFEVVKEDAKLKLITAKKTLDPDDLIKPGGGANDELKLEP
jgi:hypothetical protein